MVIDTSAVMATILREPGWERVQSALKASPDVTMSAATWVELAIVVERRLGADGRVRLDLIRDDLDLKVLPIDVHQAEQAIDAWRRYGKGRHPAGLNLGDCFSYALAAVRGDTLLYVGDDFARTDAISALDV